MARGASRPGAPHDSGVRVPPGRVRAECGRSRGSPRPWQAGAPPTPDTPNSHVWTYAHLIRGAGNRALGHDAPARVDVRAPLSGARPATTHPHSRAHPYPRAVTPRRAGAPRSGATGRRPCGRRASSRGTSAPPAAPPRAAPAAQLVPGARVELVQPPVRPGRVHRVRAPARLAARQPLPVQPLRPRDGGRQRPGPHPDHPGRGSRRISVRSRCGGCRTPLTVRTPYVTRRTPARPASSTTSVPRNSAGSSVRRSSKGTGSSRTSRCPRTRRTVTVCPSRGKPSGATEVVSCPRRTTPACATASRTVAALVRTRRSRPSAMTVTVRSVRTSSARPARPMCRERATERYAPSTRTPSSRSAASTVRAVVHTRCR